MGQPRISIILATHNRREVVLNTLARIGECGLDRSDYEILVVDNHSTDGTSEAAAAFAGVRVLAENRNRGSCAKALAVPHASAPLLVFLDDDSHPRPGCLERMLRAFERRPRLGAAGFMVHLPDGSQECSALPHVFVGCGVGLRAKALHDIGGLNLSYFMQAEEYDVSFRLLSAGWNVQVFADLHVEHQKSPLARRSARTTFYDIRNNLRVVSAHLPAFARDEYRSDWLLRYKWLAQKAGHDAAFERGLRAGELQSRHDSYRHPASPLELSDFERVFGWRHIANRMADLAASGVRRIALADWGKNVFAFMRGARHAKLDVVGIYDDTFGNPQRAYRGLPIFPLAALSCCNADAIVIANASYVHAARRTESLHHSAVLPVHNWFPAPTEVTSPGSASLTKLQYVVV